ncbi:MAG: PIN domain-containing protein [Saprospiraceae bacterium]|nr:PIN domain-containing protein [Saprospiraceae bacterium]
MDLLIDTHTLLWYYEGSSELPIKIRELINDIANNCYISIGSLWEITIKYRLGKLELENGLMDLFDFIQRNIILF